MHFLTWIGWPVRGGPRLLFDAVGLFDRGVAQELTSLVDGQRVEIFGSHQLARFAAHACLLNTVSVVEASKQVLPQTPGENRLERRLGQTAGWHHQHAHAVAVGSSDQHARRVLDSAEVIVGAAQNLVRQVIALGGLPPSQFQEALHEP